MKDVLIGWGEIAHYLRCSEKTAMRYKEKGLPVVYDRTGHPTITKADAEKWRFEKKAA